MFTIEQFVTQFIVTLALLSLYQAVDRSEINDITDRESFEVRLHCSLVVTNRNQRASIVMLS